MISLLKKVTLALFSLLFTLAMLEVAARTVKLGTGGFWEPHELYGWRNIPGASGWESCYGECQVHVAINSLGLRDREFSYERNGNQKRILLLGDSITAGMQVPLEDTFAKRLETHLNEATDDDQWEVLNAAVNGFGTDNELLFYQLEGVKYEPDIVILGVYLANDVYNNSRVLEVDSGGQDHKPYFLLSEAGELELRNFPVQATDSIAIRVGTFLKKHFQLPRFVAQTMSLRGEVPSWLRPLVQFFSGNRGVPAAAASADDQQQDEGKVKQDNGDLRAGQRRSATICDETYTPEIEEAWSITKALIRQLRTEVEASGARFAVLSVPTTGQTITPRNNANWYCERPNEELNSFLEEEGIPYLDLLQPFREYSPQGGAELYYRRDFHLNLAGHHLAGELLNEFVQEALIEPDTD